MDKGKLRSLLESGNSEIPLTLSQFIQWFEESEYAEKWLAEFEAVIESIANGNAITPDDAGALLKVYRGED